MPSATTFFLASLGGILPALLWLWFWLKEDRLHPEPRRLIIFAFALGMIAVPIVLPIEKFAEGWLISTTLVIIAWAIIEETAKLAVAYISSIRKKDCDEPIDPVIYLITAGLGFSALENTMFLMTSLARDPIASSIVTGNLRFMGASLLHVLASGIIGFFMGLAFYKTRGKKILYLAGGLVGAIALHAIFNYLIMKSQGNSTLLAFGFVWSSIALLLVAFEKVKRVRKKQV